MMAQQTPAMIADFLRRFRAHGVEQGWLEREYAEAADRRADVAEIGRRHRETGIQHAAREVM